jgi:hypothetical protein
MQRNRFGASAPMSTLERHSTDTSASSGATSQRRYGNCTISALQMPAMAKPKRFHGGFSARFTYGDG